MDAQESRIYLAIIITVLLLGTIISYFVITMVRQQRKNLELQKANALAEITAMEKERARIATDLHDDLGPVLSVVKFQIDHVELIDQEEKQELRKASGHLNNLIIRLREVANNLMPSALTRKGLLEAINEFIHNVRSSTGLRINLSISGHFNLSEEKSINIYRIIQESVHNCMKHASAKTLDLNVDITGSNLNIICKDDGKGFDKTSLEVNEGIGMRSMKNRTEMMGGKMRIDSKINKGTILTFHIPIK